MDDNQRRLCLVLLVVLLVQYHNSIRDHHYFPRSAIVAPRESPWRKLNKQGDDSLFLHVTGLNRRIFGMLLKHVFKLEEIICRHCGRHCLLGSDGYLGLLLCYLGSTMNTKHLCLIFGTTLSVCRRTINWMLRQIVRSLRNHPFARVKFPDRDKMREYAPMVQTREPLVDNIIGFMDGVSFPAKCTDDCIAQKAIYCGYDCDTMVNNVFAYGPDGKVFFAAINFPSSWADGSFLQVVWIAQGLLLCFTLISDCHRLPTVLTVGQYLANDLYKNFVLIINRALPVRHAYSGWQKASQRETAQPRRRAMKRTKCYVLRNAPVTMLVEGGGYLAQSQRCLWCVWSKKAQEHKCFIPV